jgi:hypothetical protein
LDYEKERVSKALYFALGTEKRGKSFRNNYTHNYANSKKLKIKSHIYILKRVIRSKNWLFMPLITFVRAGCNSSRKEEICNIDNKMSF